MSGLGECISYVRTSQFVVIGMSRDAVSAFGRPGAAIYRVLEDASRWGQVLRHENSCFV